MGESVGRPPPGFWFGLCLMALGLAAGLWGRLAGLGERPLAVDEFYFLTSVHAVLENGLPELAGGGYYTRALALQYATAGVMRLLGETGFAGRLPSVLLGLGSVLVAYLYARGTLSRPPAVALALMLLLSSWEIEFSRFARMYAAFQFMTLLFLLSADRAFFGGRFGLRYWPPLLAALAFFTHSVGLFLLPLLFVPLAVVPDRFPTRGHAVRYAVVCAVVSLACLAFDEAALRSTGVLDRLPEGLESPYVPLMRTPSFPFWSVSPDPLHNLAFLIAAVTLPAAALHLARRRWTSIRPADVVSTVLLTAATLHSFVIALGALAVLSLRFRVHRRPHAEPRAAAAAALGVLTLGAWLGYALARPDWALVEHAGQGSLFGSIRRTFFGWPDLYEPLLWPWLVELPVLTLVILAACAHQLVSRLSDPLPELARQPVMAVLYVAAAIGVLNSFYTTTRYAFFVYPVALAVVVRATDDLARAAVAHWGAPRRVPTAWAGATLALTLFACTEDWNPGHIARVASPEVSFRTGPWERFANTWYPRLDYVSPAEFVDREAAGHEEGTRIVLVGEPPVSHYLRAEHAVYYARDDPRFTNISREHGTRECWKGLRLLGTPEELREYTRGAERVWVIRSTQPESWPFRVEDAWPDGAPRAERRFVSRDGRIEVALVLPSRSPAGGSGSPP